MHHRQLPDDERYVHLDAVSLRAGYLVEHLFAPGRVDLRSFDLDRAIIGSAVPVHEALTLQAPPELRAAHFCERRELGVMNIGGPGSISVDGRSFTLETRACLYIGRGARQVVFASDDPRQPAAFYLVSFPAHADHPTALARPEEARTLALGTTQQANRRVLRQFIHPEGLRSCQLVMGYTEMEPGSVWNTMPPHTHPRRSEIYLYFDLPPDARLLHVMGKPSETRHLVVSDRQAVVSPSWSMHAGVGTQAYRFVWAMGGENQSFEDMDHVPLSSWF